MYLLLLFSFLPMGTQPAPVTFTTLDRGASSQIEEPRTVVVRTAAAWAALWKEHAGGRKPPAVDFTRSMVVGVFVGSRPTAGFSVEILQIAPRGETLVVTSREVRPAADAMVAQMLTAPFHLVLTASRAGEVVFEQQR